MTELRLVVPEGGGGRADRFAADLSGLSRSRVQRLIADGRVTVDGQPVKANTVVAPGAVLVIDVPPVEPAEIEAEAIPLDVVYEDDDVLVVDKPAGLVVHPSPGHWSGTLVNALLARDTDYGGIAGVERPGIVHRLDRDTSGLLMVAKTDAAQASLMAQLKARRVKKTYLALVQGSVQAAVGRIEAPIGRDPKNRMRMAVVPDGRAVGHRLPGPRAVRRLDAARGRPRHRPDPPDPGPPGRPRSLRSPAIPVYGTGTARRGPDGLERLFLHAWRLAFAVARDRRPGPPGGAPAGRPRGAPSRAARRAAGAPPAARRRRRRREPSGDRAAAGRRPGSRRPARPAPRAPGAPGAVLVVVSGPSGVGKDTIIAALRARSARARVPLRRDLHDARARGRARSTGSATTS